MRLGKSHTTEKHKAGAPSQVTACVITVSDSKFEYHWGGSDIPDEDETGDTSGKLITDRLEKAGHTVLFHTMVPDHPGLILEMVDHLIAKYEPDIIITTGGTGIASKDTTIEALESIFEKRMEGFGEYFRRRSINEVGPAAIISRATAGVFCGSLIFALPGSPNAVKTGMDIIVSEAGHMVGHARE
jgi:molybdenum cofactor biosynthesis protein B